MGCTIVGPNNPQDQSLSPDSFLNQIITVLRAKNFSTPGTEIRSGQSSYTHHFAYALNCFAGFGYCNYQTTNGTRGLFNWNETEVNTTASTSCFYGPTEVMPTRRCVSRLKWAATTVSKCRTVVSELFNKTKQVSSVI